MYIETSSPRVLGDNAKLNSPLLIFGGNMCLRFFYHMYGSTIGRLNVTINGQTVFSASGNKGNRWLEARINSSFSGNYTVRDIFMASLVVMQSNLSLYVAIVLTKEVTVHNERFSQRIRASYRSVLIG